MNRRRGHFTAKLNALLAAATIACAAGHARAQTSDETRNAARALAEEGERLYAAADYQGAADRFSRARQLLRVPTLDVWLARSLRAQGKLIEAEERYRDALRAPVATDAPPAVAKAVEEAREELDTLKQKIPSIQIARPEGVGAVTLDGAPLPDALVGVKRPVNPGAHRVEAVGAVPVSIVVREGEAARVALERLRAHERPAPRRVPSAVPADGSGSDGSTQRALGVIAIAASGVALGVAAAAGVLATSKAGTLDDACNGAACPPDAGADIDAFDTYATVSTATFIGAGALLALGIGLFVTAGRGSAARGAKASLATRTRGGLAYVAPF